MLNSERYFVQIDVNIPTIISYAVIRLRKLWRHMIGEPDLCYYCGNSADTVDMATPCTVSFEVEE